MDFHHLNELFQNHPALRLIRARNAPFVLAFFAHAFKKEGRVSVSYAQLIEVLAIYLEDSPWNEEEQPEELSSHEPTPDAMGVWEVRARRYLQQWTDAEWLYCHFDVQEREERCQLTAHAEKALLWAESLEKRAFVGAESQYEDITRKMEELVTASSDSVSEQVDALEAEQQRLSARIARIQSQGRPDRMDNYQIQARVEELQRMGKELLADFKEVEDNFQAIRKDIYRRQSQKGMTRGRVLGHTLDALDTLKQKEQGKSFYSFWQYLNNEKHQQKLDHMVQTVIRCVEERALNLNTNFLRNLRWQLHEAGKNVVASNYLLAERLNRVITGGNLQKRRHMADTIREIRELALAMPQTIELPEPFLWVEGNAELHLPLERPLGTIPQKPAFDSQPKKFDHQKEQRPGFNALFNLYAVDKAQLHQRIAQLLEQHREISLEDVLKEYPLRLGLTEVLAYMSIASESTQHDINDALESILDLPDQERLIYLPKVRYQRHGSQEGREA